jgi:mono/diheme cytochrome c family protein
MTPSLIANPWITGEADALIGYVLTGGFGPQILMARFDFLTDAEMAAVLTYVRGAFGDGVRPITPEQVRHVRVQVGIVNNFSGV